MNLSVSYSQPPIEKVTIELTPVEAKLLCQLFGVLSRKSIRATLYSPVDEVVENIFHLTSEIYIRLHEEAIYV